MDLSSLPSMYKKKQQNFEKRKQITFWNRLIYVCQFKPSANPRVYWKYVLEIETIVQFQLQILQDGGRLTGFCILDKEGHVVVVVEGSDSIVTRHLKFMQSDDALMSKIVAMKIVCIETHIGQRCNDRWVCLKLFGIDWNACARPSGIMDQEKINVLEIYDTFMKSMLKVLNFIGTACLKFSPLDNTIDESDEEFDNCMVTLSKMFPSTRILRVLLKSSMFSDLNPFMDCIFKLPKFRSYYEVVWPLPDFFLQD
ncbi:hypothetical protein LSTR_LSTR014649 [Laodelphax striatellus]|uniref:Uncharacterized protein n=1 Tax=Laodelphax striatellus TaxID=195883 RepID=A0A482XL13_LAOST|nr:hypothetical protein LSTR_LSTR010888 [Laodelphax striatellus]RZF46785.1 hypothetical protein LSTR_LSTR014649 [Laodelphax striatellus]